MGRKRKVPRSFNLPNWYEYSSDSSEEPVLPRLNLIQHELPTVQSSSIPSSPEQTVNYYMQHEESDVQSVQSEQQAGPVEPDNSSEDHDNSMILSEDTDSDATTEYEQQLNNL